MLIELDLDEAKRLELTINQFLIISLILNNINIASYQNVIQIKESDINRLKEMNILSEESELNKKFDRLWIDSEFLANQKKINFFDEFYSIYPISVIRGDGIKDYLRADVNRCRKIYNNLVGKSSSKHEEIMSALKFELSNRRANNSMKYMKRMYKWLTSEEYKTFEEYVKEGNIKTDKVQVYGTEIV